MQRLLIVDGHNLMFQMFFGMPSRIVNKDGKAIHCTLGFVGALIKIIKMVDPTNMVVLFDGEHDNFRTSLLAEYKANRVNYSTVPEELNPFSQLKDIYHALSFMGIKHTEIDVFEADDVIASYVYTCGNDTQIVISSSDSDFFQLICDHVTILRYRGIKTVSCDIDYIKGRYGILPIYYADFKSMTGDHSDNIRGAERIGIKTAAALINQFGDLRSIIKNADKIGKPSIRNSILQSSERLLTNYRIIKLDNKAELPFHMDELAYVYDGVITNEVLKGINLK